MQINKYIDIDIWCKWIYEYDVEATITLSTLIWAEQDRAQDTARGNGHTRPQLLVFHPSPASSISLCLRIVQHPDMWAMIEDAVQYLQKAPTPCKSYQCFQTEKNLSQYFCKWVVKQCVSTW